MRNRPLFCALILILLSSTMYLVYTNSKVRELLTWHSNEESYDIWVTFVRLSNGNTRTTMDNFQRFVGNVLTTSSVPITFHFIVDVTSREKVINEMLKAAVTDYKLYELDDCSKTIQDLSDVLMPHLTLRNQPYYKNSMFYLSLGLHRIAPKSQKRAVMIDCDLVFRQDVRLLFDEFKKFKHGALFGMSPELSPFYHKFSGAYRKIHPDTTFGAYYHPNETLSEIQPHPRGYQGYNSGMVLFDLEGIRRSAQYKKLFEEKFVNKLFEKYRFQGYLGDQDFYTLIGYEYPDLIQTLNCGFNRQLCTGMKTDWHYKDVFQLYFKCDHPVIVLHGNCKTPIPDE